MDKFKPEELITTKRLVLAKRSHCHDIVMWDAIQNNHDFLREYLFWVDKTTCFADVYGTTDLFSKKWDEDDGWNYSIFDQDKKRFLGCIGVHNISFMNQAAELGYWLCKSETGHGYMTEAVAALESELFKKGIHRLTILCDEHNAASAAVARRAGYELECIAKDALYHYSGLHSCLVFAKISPYPVKGF